MSPGDPRLFLLYRSLEELADLELTTDSYQEAFETIQQVFMGVLGASRGALLVMQLEKNHCEVAYKRGLELPVGFCVPVTGLTEEMESVLKEVGVEFVMPLYHRTRCMGLVMLGEKMNAESYSLEDRRLVQPIANLVGMVLSNYLNYFTSLSKREELQQENRHLKKLVETRFSIREVVGASAAYHKIIRQAEILSNSTRPVLLTGELGTGKEFMARFIHQNGPRALHQLKIYDHDMIIRDQLLQMVPDKIFQVHKDWLARVKGGTVVILGLEYFDFEQQTVLTQLLEKKEFGSIADMYDLRIIATTRRHPVQLVEQGYLRPELYDIFKDSTIELVPLADRREDIAILAQKALETLCVQYRRPNISFSAVALRALTNRDYQENIRDLENLIEAAVVSLPLNKQVITLGTLQGCEFKKMGTAIPIPVSFDDLEEIKEEMVLQALERNGWKKVAAAEALGVTRQTIDNLASRYKIRRSNHA